jgi:hypothetical protein
MFVDVEYFEVVTPNETDLERDFDITVCLLSLLLASDLTLVLAGVLRFSRLGCRAVPSDPASLSEYDADTPPESRSSSDSPGLILRTLPFVCLQ